MQGSSAENFASLDGWAHVVQSIRDILTTPVGSRVLRRDYGSQVPALLDRPMNAETTLDFVIATADALDRWEPRVRLERCVLVEADVAGRGALDLDLVYLEDGRNVTARIAL